MRDHTHRPAASTTIAKVLQECRGNKTKAARRLGLSRTQLHLRIRKYGLEQAAAA
jgi:transcriptional regulator of acetoin/glycerol metabolism